MFSSINSQPLFHVLIEAKALEEEFSELSTAVLLNQNSTTLKEADLWVSGRNIISGNCNADELAKKCTLVPITTKS